MEHKVVVNGNMKYVEAGSDFIISEEQDAVDIAAFCWENETENLLLVHENLNNSFFDLKSGLAGAVLQKFSNYRIRAAAVIDEVKISGRFSELTWELNRGNSFRIFDNRDEAVSWLLKK